MAGSYTCQSAFRLIPTHSRITANMFMWAENVEFTCFHRPPLRKQTPATNDAIGFSSILDDQQFALAVVAIGSKYALPL